MMSVAGDSPYGDRRVELRQTTRPVDQICDRSRSLGSRTFGLSTVMIVVGLAAVLFALFRQGFVSGIAGSVMLASGSSSVVLANVWRRARGRRPLSVGESLLEFVWVGISSIAWGFMGSLTLFFPVIAILGESSTSQLAGGIAGAIGALAGVTITVYRGACWGLDP